ncbi:MAG: hypothetical protein AAF702_43930 [Chloroflexota bacterium]
MLTRLCQDIRSKTMPRLITTAILLSLIVTLSANLPVSAFDIDPGAVHYIVPTGDWLAIEPGERHLYQFSYDSFKEPNGRLSTAFIKVKMADRRSLTMKIYSSNDIPKWERGGEITPIGMGTELGKLTAVRSDRTTHVWESKSVASQDYYVIIEAARPVTAYYEIKISGSGVYFPEVPEAAPEEVATEETGTEVVTTGEATEETNVETTASEPAADAPPAEATVAQATVTEEAVAVEESPSVDATTVVSPTGGTGPDDALAPESGYITLAPREKRWYVFNYYKDAGRSATEARVVVKIPVERSITFDILSENEVAKWRRGEKFSPVGNGTPMDFGKDYRKDPNTLVWLGRSDDGGRYYVIVENKTDQEAGFSMEVSGPTVYY